MTVHDTRFRGMPRPPSSRASRATSFSLYLGLGASALLASGCATFPPVGGESLQEEIDRIISQPPLDQVTWGIRIVDPERGQILYSRHAHLKFVPASNMKILATVSALSLLGSEYRHRTELFGVGPIQPEEGILEGDLLLRPGGDPTLSHRFYPSAEAPLDSLAEGVWAAGVRTVTGSLVVDVSAWDSTTVPGTWEVDDLPATYAATGGAFSIAEGVLSVEVKGGPEAGTPAQARWWPYLDDTRISVAFTTIHPDRGARGRRVEYQPESRRLRLRGGIPAGETDTIRVSQRDPVRLASVALLQALERRGIQVFGGVRIAWDPGDPVGPGGCTTGPVRGSSVRPDESNPAMPPSRTRVPQKVGFEGCPEATQLAELLSPPLAEVVQAILEPSQNWMTEQLVRVLGSELGTRGSWREGFRVEGEFFTETVGVDSLDLSFRDGSGMSRQNLVTPRAIVRILDFIRDSAYSGIFRNALASPGEEDSTLERRLLALEGRVFAKTGTLTHVTSLSGYVFTDSGKELIFSILTNGSGLSSGLVREGVDRIVEAAARY